MNTNPVPFELTSRDRLIQAGLDFKAERYFSAANHYKTVISDYYTKRLVVPPQFQLLYVVCCIKESKCVIWQPLNYNPQQVALDLRYLIDAKKLCLAKNITIDQLQQQNIGPIELDRCLFDMHKLLFELEVKNKNNSTIINTAGINEVLMSWLTLEKNNLDENVKTEGREYFSEHIVWYKYVVPHMTMMSANNYISNNIAEELSKLAKWKIYLANHDYRSELENFRNWARSRFIGNLISMFRPSLSPDNNTLTSNNVTQRPTVPDKTQMDNLWTEFDMLVATSANQPRISDQPTEPENVREIEVEVLDQLEAVSSPEPGELIIDDSDSMDSEPSTPASPFSYGS